MKPRTITAGIVLAATALVLSGCNAANVKHHGYHTKTHAYYGKTQKYHVDVTPVHYKTVSYKKVLKPHYVTKKVYKPHYIKKVIHH